MSVYYKVSSAQHHVTTTEVSKIMAVTVECESMGNIVNVHDFPV